MMTTLRCPMTDLDITKESSVAFITRTSQVLIETRFKDDVRITLAGLMENIAIRRDMCKGKPHVMLTVVLGEHEVEPAVIRTDLYRLPEDRAAVKAIALVIDGDLLPLIVKMYFEFFPQTFRTAVFSNEEEARTWLDKEAEGLN